MGEVISYTKDGVDQNLANAIYGIGTDGNVLLLTKGDGTVIQVPIGLDSVVNAGVNGNDLVLTKGDGSTVTVTLPVWATQADVDAAVASLVDSSPETLNTLNELAAAIGDDPNFFSTYTTALMAKAPLTTAMGVVAHGADANVARPTGYAVVHWIGTVEPVNAAENDLWTNA